MVIVNPDGSLTLESGDPDFQSIIPDITTPTNIIIDPLDVNKTISQLVLETFNIPFNAVPILGSTMPGFDIKNQDAITMLKLSLATELLAPPDGSSGFAEVELDEFGIARFFVVGADTANNLDIRYCIPTGQITTPADLVIVRGFDPPPRRELRTSFDGLKNAELMEFKECAAGSCDEKAVGKFATISYDDPLLDQVYLDDIINSYELKAFESLIGYIIDLDLPDGADRDDANFIQGLKITFGDTTKEYIKVGANLINNFVNVGTTSPAGGFGSLGGNITSTTLGFGSANRGGGSINVSVTTVDEKTGDCTVSNTSIAGSKVRIPASRFERLNKFGNIESDFIGVSEVIFSGRKVVTFTIFGDISFDIFVRTQKELVALPHGKNWVWDVDPITGDIEIELFSILEDEFSASVCDLYQNGAGTQGIFLHTTDTPNQNEAVGSQALLGLSCNIGDRLGYKIINDQMCIVVDRKRPSIDVFDPQGKAASIARQFIDPAGPFGIRYTPLVIIDEPAPIAYAATGVLTGSDPTVTNTLPAEGIIDQADGIVDADPTTTQDLEESQLSILQDNTNGATIDVTFPFCTDQECLQIAQNFLAQQQQLVTTTSVVLGPTSEPRLGQVTTDGAVINEINYSYSDSSQYLITITTGPKYLTAGSFNASNYQLKTEDVTREGVVLQDAGNGAEYVVRIEGFGEITALSMIIEDISVGDRVNVRIYNNPVERV